MNQQQASRIEENFQGSIKANIFTCLTSKILHFNTDSTWFEKKNTYPTNSFTCPGLLGNGIYRALASQFLDTSDIS